MPRYVLTDVAFVDEWLEIVVVKDCWWQDSNRDLHVGISYNPYVRWVSQVDIFKIAHHEMCIGSGHNTVEE